MVGAISPGRTLGQILIGKVPKNVFGNILIRSFCPIIIVYLNNSVFLFELYLFQFQEMWIKGASIFCPSKIYTVKYVSSVLIHFLSFPELFPGGFFT